ncbi:MAG: TonB-dependent receptor, partial [Flavobacteriales bacterium]|nr:TonB-dependent receptor [Flavobacteriales bacterium]
VSASVNIIDDLMIAYASIDGEMRQNSLQSVVAEMPYLSPTMEVKPTSVQYDVSAGIKGKLMSNLAYNTNISYRKENGFIQFIDSKGEVLPLASTPNGWDAWNSFNVVQDTVGVFEFFAEVEYKVIKDLNVTANFMFNSFNSKGYDKVYNKPKLRISATADYRFLEDFTVGTSMYFVGERSYVNNPVSASPTVSEEGQLPSYFDLNLNAGYDVNKKLGTFLRLNNVLNQDYELYKNYPVQGFQIMAGVTYKF